MPLRTKGMIGRLGGAMALIPMTLIPITLIPITLIVTTLSTPMHGIDAQPLMAAPRRYT